jgi:hypothetical protein
MAVMRRPASTRITVNPLVGWALAALALLVGHATGGWQGVVLALTVVVFWLVLQFSRTLRVMRAAAQLPVGYIPNAVMFATKLHPGMPLLDVIGRTRSLGQRVSGAPEIYAWVDAGGDAVRATFESGRLARWELVRATSAPSDVANAISERAVDP